MGATDETKYLTATQIEEFKRLEQRVLAHLDRNDYQWISPTLFSNVFSSKRVTA